MMPVAADPSVAVSQAHHANGDGMMGNRFDVHTFLVIGPDGRILWRADYGGASTYNMYVPVNDLLADIERGLAATKVKNGTVTPLRILLLTQEKWTFCDLAKQALDGLSAEFPLSVSTLSMDTPRGRELAQQNGMLFAAELFIDDKAFSYGRLSERKLRRTIAERISTRLQ